MTYPVLSSDLQVAFHFRLKSIKELYFHDALKKALQKVKVKDIDKQLNKFVSNQALAKAASFGLRGEVMFPVPLILIKNPYLLGYYRLLYGISQKEFYSSKAFGSFKKMEEGGKITSKAEPKIDAICQSLCKTGETLVDTIDELSLAVVHDLQMLTVGPLLRGSMNNTYGQAATQLTFNLIRDLVKSYIDEETPTSIIIVNDSGRKVKIEFASDPDIQIIEVMKTGNRGLISIEIKGGTDISNIHNRVGEAEKSHQKAKKRGYHEFMTIVRVNIDYEQLRHESPTTSHFFHLDRITKITSAEHESFRDILSSILSINI